MKSVTSVLIVLASLTACTPATSNNKLNAPDVREYSSEKQLAAEKEVRGMACPVLTDFAIDYCVMRDQSRVLLGEKPRCTKKLKTLKTTHPR